MNTLYNILKLTHFQDYLRERVSLPLDRALAHRHHLAVVRTSCRGRDVRKDVVRIRLLEI